LADYVLKIILGVTHDKSNFERRAQRLQQRYQRPASSSISVPPSSPRLVLPLD
jgi:hypothetical protein